MNNIKFIICMAVLIGVNGFYSSDLLAKNLRANEAFLGKGKFALVGDYQRRIRNQEMALQNKIDKKLIKALDNLENDPKAAEAALENLANKAVQADGIKGDVDIELYNSDTMTPEQLAEVEVLGKKYGKDEFGGFYDPKSGKIYVNASKLDGTRSQVSGILANELTHYVDHKKGRIFDQKRQDLSTEQQQNMIDQFAGYNGEESVSQEEKASFQDSIKKQDFSDGNVNASGVIELQPWAPAKEYGTTLTGLSDEIAKQEDKVDSVFNKLADRDAILTFTTNGVHSAKSLHYKGDAIDIRTRDLSPEQITSAKEMLQKKLGSDYDVINEGTHIHVEYDPD